MKKFFTIFLGFSQIPPIISPKIFVIIAINGHTYQRHHTITDNSSTCGGELTFFVVVALNLPPPYLYYLYLTTVIRITGFNSANN